ncbi:MAG TPA: recombinase family protein [Chloroflexota bacterium]|jgi:site-specific DNA recombinase
MARPRKPWMPKPTAVQRTVRRVMGYVRVSTAEQSDTGYGLDAQRDAIRAYCSAAGYELLSITEDAGLSGTLDAAQRPGLAAVLAAVDAGDVDGVVVKALDRIGRRPAVATAFFEALDAAGVAFLSITEPFLSSDLLRGLFAGIASDERRRILDRTSSGRTTKAAQGGYAGGRVPYGYALEGSRKDARWVIDPAHATIVQRIYTERAAGHTYQQIADALNADGIPSPAGSVWQPRAVYVIVGNPAYTGTRRWREGTEIVTEGAHAPIIDAAVFHRLQPAGQAA